ncbi:MAG: CpcT/CpeT family chromophore lyase [Gammaproteobacteria bacterium]|jgi:hypothetical protein|nr:CpcT/CpeT family chromophore lyase [Gammaproteobacteria bacterium]MDP6617736.1 CpcT/CpeT family chromophore lyase [Gammaproteobacteria bacterium]MDP6694122.1 CpcT/CpeT family chromophore lyase [Gammaproteobacteria bacterium]
MKPYQVLLLALFVAGCESPEPAADALGLVRLWVQGNYNNLAQTDADIVAGLPTNLTHRPMHQLFVPVEVPGIEGHLVFQQSSLDGSEEPAMIFRHGLMQYFFDQESGLLRQRELYFKDAEPYKNAHRNPAVLEGVTLDDMTWDAGCDFFLQANADNTMVSGPIAEGNCVLFNEGLQKNMYADDLVEITATEYRFRGRYVDEAGAVLWGTESDELNRLVRQE